MCDEDRKNTTEQLQALEIGRGLQYLLNEAYRILGNPVLVLDMEYKLVACSENAVLDDPIWNEFMLHGQLGAETIEFIKNEGFIDAVADSTLQNGVTYLISDKLKYDRVFGQLYNKSHIPVADMVLVGSECPFGDDTLELARILCEVLSKELMQNAYYQDYGQSYKESIIKELLAGGISDHQIYTGHIANIDKALKTNIFIAVADVAGCDGGHAALASYRALLERTQPAFEYFVCRAHIVILMSWDDDALPRRERDLKKLRRLFERESICAGVSSGFENLFEARTYYAEAVAALEHGLNGGGAERIYFYDEIKP